MIFRNQHPEGDIMKLLSKIVLIAAMGATALTTLSGMASAQETYAVTKYEFSREAGVDTQGLSFGLTGRYDSGFAYDLKLLSADTSGVGSLGADIELGYRFNGIAGPVALYEVRKDGGTNSDQLLVGVEGGLDLQGFELGGKALIDVNNRDNWRLAAGAEYGFISDLTLRGELTHFNNDAAPNQNQLEVGARYKLSGALHADVGATYGRTQGGAEMTGVQMGLGFKF